MAEGERMGGEVMQPKLWPKCPTQYSARARAHIARALAKRPGSTWAEQWRRKGRSMDEVEFHFFGRREQWCTGCEAWQPWELYPHSPFTPAGCLSRCHECRRERRRKGCPISRRHNATWTHEETAYLLRMTGSMPRHKLSKQLGRTDTAVRKKLSDLGLRNAPGGDNFHPRKTLASVLGVSATVLRTWEAQGLTTHTHSGARVYSGGALKQFLRRRPEALDVMGLPDWALEIMGWDLDEWPEPPSFKIIECADGHLRPCRWVVDLYGVRPRCPVCRRQSTKWAAGYTNNWRLYDA